jgi:hypothetical protein
MRNDPSRNCRKEILEDIGTLWSMQRHEHRARCALLASGGDWEIRVFVDGTALLIERCEGLAATFALAERWKRQMIAQGWHQILPALHRRPRHDERSTA